MATGSTIEWTEATWNPVTGCTKISPGCRNCYAERMSKRLKGMGQPNYIDGFKVKIHPHTLTKPLSWKKPKTVFVNSMSDLFHTEVPFSYIESVFEVMREAHQHTFQILTKRSERLAEIAGNLHWPQNVWMGVSVEDKRSVGRIDDLRKVPAALKFLSIEPLLGSLGDLNLEGIDWVIVGGESGPGARPMDSGWVTPIRDACCENGIPFFFKQWGGVWKKRSGRLLDGRTWDEAPSFQTVSMR